MFGLSQYMCNKWIHILTPLVKKSLEEYGASRNQAALQKQLEEHHTYLIDATERPIEHPIHDQESYYSGKKKAHTIKNLLLARLCGYILFIGTTVEGKKHDKRIADEQKVSISQSLVWGIWVSKVLTNIMCKYCCHIENRAIRH